MDIDEALADLLKEYEYGVKERQVARTQQDMELGKSQRRSIKDIENASAKELKKIEAERDELLDRVTNLEQELLTLYQSLADSEQRCTESRESIVTQKEKEDESLKIKQILLLQERAAEDAVHRLALQQRIVRVPSCLVFNH